MTDIKKFTSFATSNCYLISPFDNEIVFLIDLPPNIDAVSYTHLRAHETS